jgi:hypothetical protein
MIEMVKVSARREIKKSKIKKSKIKKSKNQEIKKIRN